jgi:hypothetical protein
MHKGGLCESATMCKNCHDKLHGNTKKITKAESNPEIAKNWTVTPRKFPLIFAQSTSNRKAGTIGLVGLQCMYGFGWHILNGNIDSRIVTVNTKNFAKLIGKTSGTSFKKSLRGSLGRLEELAILNAYAFDGDNVEVHFDSDYLDEVADNPWFIPLSEVRTKRMPVLTLRTFLSYLTGERTYKIGLDKLALYLNLETRSNRWLINCIENACEEIPWAEVTMKKDVCHFHLSNRGSTPIFTLRSMLRDSLVHGG